MQIYSIDWKLSIVPVFRCFGVQFAEHSCQHPFVVRYKNVLQIKFIEMPKDMLQDLRNTLKLLTNGQMNFPSTHTHTHTDTRYTLNMEE